MLNSPEAGFGGSVSVSAGLEVDSLVSVVVAAACLDEGEFGCCGSLFVAEVGP